MFYRILFRKDATKNGLIDTKEAKEKIQKIMDTYDLPVNLDEKDIPAVCRRKAEWRLLRRCTEARILILDVGWMN